MHIISGTAKGRPLKTPKTHSVRPASQKVKEAIFDILVHGWRSMEGIRVLDLFAGSGSLGIEALSRGASYAAFVEGSRKVLNLIESNLESVEFSHRAETFRLELPWGLKKLQDSFDLVFIDPPYDQSLVLPSIRQVMKQKILAVDGRIIVEHSTRETVGANLVFAQNKGRSQGSPLQLVDQRKYGQTLISIIAYE